MTNAIPYAKQPHLDIQRALLEAKRQGATTAAVRFDNTSRQATLRDNRHGDDQPPHSQHFNNNIHPADGFQWTTQEAMRCHIAPGGLQTTLELQYTETIAKPRPIPSLGDNCIATAQTPNRRYRIHLAKDRQYPSFTVLHQDGTTGAIRPEQGSLSYHSTDSRQPDSEVQTRHFAIIAETLADNDLAPDHTEDREQIFATSTHLAVNYLDQLNQESQGYVWPQGRLDGLIAQHHPEHPQFARPESTSDYMVEREDGARRTTTRITPSNAVLCDYDDVQTDLLDYAVRKHAPRDVLPVRTKALTVPTIRLLAASVENLDGTTIQYPVNTWNMERQSGRTDGRPTPRGTRLPHSRIDKVKRIELTMEIRQRDSQDSPDVFTFQTDAYADQDRRHHILLITQDSTITDDELKNIAYLHEPRLPQDAPPQVRDAVYESLSNTYQTYLVDQLRNGPEHAALSLLGRTAAALEALALNNPSTGTSATVEAASGSGSVRITLNPPQPSVPFRFPNPPIDFVQADPQSLPGDAAALFLPTREPPGAIRTGHVLIYSTYDGKLETFQPRDTHFTHRVHPFTVRPKDCPNLQTVRDSPDTGWLVVAATPTYLLLHPVALPE